MISSLVFERTASLVVSSLVTSAITREIMAQYGDPCIGGLPDGTLSGIMLGLYRAVICQLKFRDSFLDFFVGIDVCPDVATISGRIEILPRDQSASFVEKKTRSGREI